jgi:hypothetical protein
LSYVLAAIGILGLWIAGSGNKWGWTLGIFAQFLWAWYAISTKQYGFLISCAGYGFVYVRNFFKKEKHENRNLDSGIASVG